MTTDFTLFNLHPQVLQAVGEAGFTTPTPIQAGIIPLMLTGEDVIGQAQTGTGKTAAFALPMLNNLEPDLGFVQGLVLAPTRELALQVAEAMVQFGRHRGVRVLPVYGGQPYSRQISRLKKGVDVVVGTPGRLLDLLEKKALNLSQAHTVVLDEADEMLSMGFVEDIEAILAETPPTRQTALFSATLPPEIRRLAEKYMVNPRAVTIEREKLAVAAIEQRYYLVNEADKLAALTRLFEMEEISRALIFVRTRVGTGELANELTVRGFPAESLNGDLSQEARERVMARFRNDQIKVLVATDVAARGLDIDDISHVFNFDLPEEIEVYVHRIGRTGRAGKTGIAISLLTPREQWRLRRIEKFAGQGIARATLPTVEDINRHRETSLMEQVEVWLRRGRCQRERELVTELVEAGHDPLEIAAITLKMARAEEKQRPIAHISEVQTTAKKRPSRRAAENGSAPHNGSRRGSSTRSHEAGMVRLTLSRGRAHGIRPNEVVSSLAYYANIPGSSIGRISIEDKHTLVDVPEQFASQVLAKTGNYRIKRQTVTVERA